MLRFWFYDACAAKADGRKPSWTERVIMMRSPLTHVEVEFMGRNIWFSSTMAEGAGGCRMMRHTMSHPQWWKTVTVPLNDKQTQRAWEKACAMAALPTSWMEQIEVKPKVVYRGWLGEAVSYDKWGLLSFALQRSGKWWLDLVRGLVWGWTLVAKPDMDGVWCSEACAIVLKAGLGIDQFNGLFPTEISPSELHVLVLRVNEWLKRGLVI